MIADLGHDIVWFTEAFPDLTKYIGYAAVGVLALVSSMGLLNIIMGLFVIISSPISLVAIAIAAVVASGYALYKYFDQIKAFLGKSDWGTGVLSSLESIIETMKTIGESFSTAFGGLSEYFSAIMPVLKLIGGLFLWIFATIVAKGIENFSFLFKIVGTLFSWILTAIGKIAGAISTVINFTSDLFGNSTVDVSAAGVDAIAPIKSQAQTGGITQQISNANQQKSTSIGEVKIYPAKGETNLMNFVEMHS